MRVSGYCRITMHRFDERLATDITCLTSTQVNRSQLTIALAVVVGSWYAMMGVHEAGHCLGVMATGGKIERVEMPLVGFSRTDVSGSRCPLAVVWAGPVFGAAAPLLLLTLLSNEESVHAARAVPDPSICYAKSFHLHSWHGSPVPVG